MTSSLHVAGTHSLFVQILLAQSSATAHFLLSPQAEHCLPPQSTSVSSDSRLLLVQWLVQPSSAQNSLVQPRLTVQPRPSSQVTPSSAHDPPQSTPVSLPFCRLSEQLGAVHRPFLQNSVSKQSVLEPQC